MLNIGMNLQRLAVKSGLQFTPASLFNNGEAGVWYDPSAASDSLNWRKNLLEYTESFDNSAWEKSNSFVSEDVISGPYENTLADKFVGISGAGIAFVLQNAPLVGRQRYTQTIFAKAGEVSWIQIAPSSGFNNGHQNYNLATGELGTNTSGIDNVASIENIGNGWYRCSLSTAATSTTTGRFATAWVGGDDNRLDSDGTVTPDSVKGVYIWGAQLEEASTASSYQPILSTFDSAFKAAFPSHTLYQDSQGSTPVTAVGQPVGLMLDKSEGLAQGPELVTNGDFATDSGWNKGTGWSISGGKATCTGGSSQFLFVNPTVTEEGQRITIEVTVTDYTSGTLYISFSTGGEDVTTAMTSTGTYTFSGVISGNDIWYLRGINFVGSIDNVSAKAVAGSHATQPTSTKRPIYARHPEGGIRNLLNYTEQFDNGYWNKLASTVNPNAGIAPDGTQTADRLNFTTSSSSRVEVTISGTPANVPMVMSIWLKSESGNQTVEIGEQTKSTVTATTEWQRFIHSYNDSDGNIYPRIENSNDGVARSVLAWGAQVEEATEASNYQKVVTDIDVTESGVGEVYYLKFDGIDDGMAINNLTSGITPITALFGYSATNAEDTANTLLVDIETGRTFLASSAATAGKIGYYDGAYSEFEADSNVLKVLTYDLVENDAKIRIDGTQEYSDTTYDERAIGGRVGLFSNLLVDANEVAGNMYQIILRAAESTDEEIAKAETYVANKTGLKAQVDGIATLDLNFGANLYTAKNSNGGVI